ncbi:MULTISPECIES: response regulator [Bosea]|jgi:CheY-like chemotaxis protein|uniref:response regulator n=1 Tax=Bosea TaxID=85413 RepID=UPI0038575FC2
MKSCVLVVEEGVFIRLDVIAILEDAGFEVLEAGNADEAIRVLESRSGIDVVLTDIERPGSIDGIGLLMLRVGARSGAVATRYQTPSSKLPSPELGWRTAR